MVSIGICRYRSIDDQSITTQKQFIDWHNSNPVFSMQRIYPIACVLELPTCPSISNQWKSMIGKPINTNNDNHTILRNRYHHYQYQSIDWYRLVLIDIDCHRLETPGYLTSLLRKSYLMMKEVGVASACMWFSSMIIIMIIITIIII